MEERQWVETRTLQERKGSRHQRIVARTVFGVTVAVLLAVAGLPLGLSLAQVTPTIEIINPHTGTSLVVSDKGQHYHLNSWVNQVPPNPLVEYELDIITTDVILGSEDVETVTIGTATQEGNAFGLLWDIENDIHDESDDPTFTVTYELRAILYTNFTGTGTGVEVARDEQAITINHEDDPNPQTRSPEDAAETVQLTYPTNGGPLGVYIKPDGSGGNFTLDGIVSAQARFVEAFYTISEFGEDPAWRSCGGPGGTFVTDDAGVRTARIRCSTAAGDYALDVTGVALVTNDTPSPAGAQDAFNDGADAHAVVPYFQTVNSVVIDPELTSAAPNNNDCVQLKATVLDSNSRPIGLMNVDVMAQGPSDQLKFDTYTGNGSVSDGNQVPDKGHPGSDPAISCNGGSESGSNGRQGEHNSPGGADLKHIESTTGTDLSGEFEFALATDRPGATQIKAFADETDDDKLCSGEKSDDASIGWEEGAPSPSGFPSETDTCSVTTPSPSPTPTESASPSDSPSNGTTSPPPRERHSRDVTIGFDHGSLIVSGRVSVDDGTNKCRRDVSVQVQRRKNKRWQTKKTVFTNSAGRYSATLRDVEGKYRARAVKTRKGNDVCRLTTAVKRHRH